jgi:hypothetical protein
MLQIVSFASKLNNIEQPLFHVTVDGADTSRNSTEFSGRAWMQRHEDAT